MCRIFIAIFFLLSSVDLTQAQTDRRLDVKPDPSDPSRFLCDIGFATFTTPKSWKPNRSGKSTYAILTPEADAYPKISKMISIDVGKPVDPSPEAIAQGFAKTWKGAVQKETIQVDGEKGYRIVCPPDPNKVQPIDCVVVLKDGRAVLLIAGAKKSGETDDAMNELVKSWKWKSKSN
ncbi:MAG: hypothetical protein ACK480_14355 [Planctomycetota bacterium]